MRRRLFAAVLAALLMLMMTAAICAAEEKIGDDGLYVETPVLQRVRQETASETAEGGVTLRRTYPSTANAQVDAQMRALVDDMAARGVALGEDAPQMTQLDVGAVITRTGTKWMSFLTLAEATAGTTYLGVEAQTRVYDMESGTRLALTDVFAPESEAWERMAQAVREQLTEAFPGEEPDARALDALCTREALEAADFTLGATRLLLTYRAGAVYHGKTTLLHVSLGYDEYRPLMKAQAQAQTDNSRWRMAALTFDDGGAVKYTSGVLDALRQYGAQATFFIVGNRMAKNACVLYRQQNCAYSLQSHSYTHKYQLTGEEMLAQKEQFAAEMGAMIGVVPALMRAPGGMETGYVKHEIGYPLIHWSLASRDSGSEDYKRIANYVCYNIEPGEIVLMHDLNPYSPRYAGLILERLCDQGYLFVTVEELFAQAGIELEPNVVYYSPNREPVRPEAE